MAEAELTTASTPQDAHLLRALRAGDSAAYAELCDRYGRRVHRYLASRLRDDPQTAEELAIQVLADAVRNLRHFDPRRATLLAWLFGLARRQVIAELRRRSRRKSVPAEAQVSLTSAAELALADDPTGALASRLEAQRQVADLRAHLAEAEWEVLLLHCVHELSLAEIAHALHRSERAINSLLHRARTKARERLGSDA